MIAFIPARGGSKGLPGKNIRKLCDKPLIAYTIEAAKSASSVDMVIVSTDSKEIADVAIQAGAEVPFLRPDDLASDTASAVDVYIHAVEFAKDRYGQNIKKFMVLLPTAPLRSNRHIDEAFDLFSSSDADTLISVTEAEVPPSWYMTIDEGNHIRNATFGISKGFLKNRQENEKYYIPNGAIYILDYNMLKEKRTYYSDKTIPYIMNRTNSIDIDTIDDFNYAEYLIMRRL